MDGKFGKDVLGSGREGQARARRMPMAGKKEHLRSLYLCVSCCVVRLSPVFPPQHRLQPLACKPVRKKDASSQVPGFCLKCEREMQEMKSPPSLPRPVSAADFEQH